MRKIVLICLCLILLIPIIVIPSTAIGNAYVSGKITVSGSNPEQTIQGVKVKMIYNGVTVATTYSSSLGQYTVKYPEPIANSINVLLKYEKNGYCTKTLGATLIPGTIARNVALASSYPTAVTGLQVIDYSYSHITLAWNPNTEYNLDCYKVYRDTFFIDTSVDNTYRDGNVAPSTEYFYYVSAVVGDGREGGYSSAVYIATMAPMPPTQVQGLTASVEQNKDVHLNWSANPESNVHQYRLYRDGVLIDELGEDVTTYIDWGKPPGAYTYTVSALNTYGQEGPESEPATAIIRGWYALLVGASAEDRFARDSFAMYDVLIDHYGFSDERTYYLCTRNSIDGSDIPRDDDMSKSNLLRYVGYLAGNVTENDYVLLWWTGHGHLLPTGQGAFDTSDTGIYDYELDAALDAITCCRMYIFLGPCHSGAFIDDLNDTENRAIFASCQPDEVGNIVNPRSTDDNSYFPMKLWKYLDPDFEADIADCDDDQRVSLEELWVAIIDFFDTMNAEDPADWSPQHPQSWIGLIIGPTADEFIGDDCFA